MSNSKTIIAVTNQKGGVAKTTSVINIGAGLATKGKKVLLVDMDNQSDLSDWFGYDGKQKPTITDLIWNTVSQMVLPVESAVYHSDTENIDYIPSDSRLSSMIAVIGTDSDSMGVIARLFDDSFFDKYDYIIFDCPPNLDLIVANILKACDKVLIPVQSEKWAYKGVNQLLTVLQRVKNTADVRQYVLGMLITMCNSRTNSAKTVIQSMKDSYGDYVFDTVISYLNEVKVSSMTGESLIYNNTVTGQQYMEIVDEILNREEKT